MKSTTIPLWAAPLALFIMLCGASGISSPAQAQQAPATSGPTITLPSYPSVHWWECGTESYLFCVTKASQSSQPLGSVACQVPLKGGSKASGWCLGSAGTTTSSFPCPGSKSGNLVLAFALGQQYYLTIADNKAPPSVAGGLIQMTPIDLTHVAVKILENPHFLDGNNLPWKGHAFTLATTPLAASVGSSGTGAGTVLVNGSNQGITLSGFLSCNAPLQIDGKWADTDGEGGPLDITFYKK